MTSPTPPSLGRSSSGPRGLRSRDPIATTIAVTGANSSVGLNLLGHVAGSEDLLAIAVVRSERAAAALPVSPQITPKVISYDHVDGLAGQLDGAESVVHLAGILFESKTSRYEGANVRTAASVVSAARGAGCAHIVLVSVLGADAASPNRYLASKGMAELHAMESGLGATILRTPILLGPGTAGAAALRRAASAGTVRLLGGGRHTLRPLDLDDLSAATLGACRARPDGVAVHELVGPEPVTYRELVARAGEAAGASIAVTGVPIWLAKAGAALSSRLKGGGMSPDVIDVITASEHVSTNADAELGVRLTPLSTTLEKILSTQ